MTTNTKLNAATRILINDEGVRVRVNYSVYNEARSAFKEGCSFISLRVGKNLFTLIDLEQSFKNQTIATT